MRIKRKAAEVAREAIRTTLQTISKKQKRPNRKCTTIHVKSVIKSLKSKRNNAIVTNNKRNESSIRLNSKQSNNTDKSSDKSFLTNSDIYVYNQLKQLPNRLMVQLPCGVICDAAKRLQNADYSTLAGFIIFRTDLHPFNHGYKQKNAH
ncbi:hypothetical protein QQG55_29340 [Brugia pahangi]|uniref:Autophagy-related protein n=1 Tax=Brugia pahangi TaxID=6280 RepID=A0A0N4TQA5_BRUPA|nr:unnamed protein product [Brugia pahangi]